MVITLDELLQNFQLAQSDSYFLETNIILGNTLNSQKKKKKVTFTYDQTYNQKTKNPHIDFFSYITTKFSCYNNFRINLIPQSNTKNPCHSTIKQTMINFTVSLSQHRLRKFQLNKLQLSSYKQISICNPNLSIILMQTTSNQL